MKISEQLLFFHIETGIISYLLFVKSFCVVGIKL